MIFSFSNVIILSSINSFGNIVIAGTSPASNLEGFVYVSMNGIAQGTLTFVSQNTGAHKSERIKRVVIDARLTVLVTGLVIGNLFYFAGRPLLSLYTTNPDVIEAGIKRLNVICCTYALCGMMDTMGYTVRGMGHSLMPMIFSLLGACVFRLIWLGTAFQVPALHNEYIIFLSYPLSWILTLLAHFVSFIFVFSKVKKQMGVVKE